MTIRLSKDLEALVQKRLATGTYADVEDIIRRALEALEDEESRTDEGRRALHAKIDRAAAQLERVEGIPGDEGWRQQQQRKAAWLKENRNPSASRP